ncbi:MAG TPA: hypothetical protein VKA67_14050 [Verrucomicrobiae bacterium]|nr:hypothetical protein [Verrucomicrobiae bacterium]
MFLGVFILVAAGAYVFLRKEVKASSKLVIRGKPASHIGVALMAGGLLAVLLPTGLNDLGLLKGFVSGFVLAIGTMFVSLVYVTILIWIEKRRQAEKMRAPRAADQPGS